MRNPGLHFFLLKKRVIFDLTLGFVKESSKIIKILSKKELEYGLE